MSDDELLSKHGDLGTFILRATAPAEQYLAGKDHLGE